VESQPRRHRGSILSDPALRHVYFDISWDEVAKYILSSPAITRRAAR
jgi:hypothetical protein